MAWISQPTLRLFPLYGCFSTEVFFSSLLFFFFFFFFLYEVVVIALQFRKLPGLAGFGGQLSACLPRHLAMFQCISIKHCDWPYMFLFFRLDVGVFDLIHLHRPVYQLLS
ncbi:hypothetical protein BDV28DRAFT_134227 [Aspergillus coremiiformis]|uniref:Uncharacterized protein n=1 Tax=Aspergillus coremiiformis TaxID=138285 RepID=A0A5N6Z661_9EURO|nr:hypothetical protein BDV28DRAFT_134227 [Aspergillus coremiiformis]